MTEEPCSICYEKYNSADISYKLSCNHVFHKACLKRCKPKRCPLCRKKFVMKSDASEITILKIESDEEFQVSENENGKRVKTLIFSEGVLSDNDLETYEPVAEAFYRHSK